MKTEKQTKHDTEEKNKKKEGEKRPNTDVETDTGKRPKKDSNPLPPNPNEVDNHGNKD